MLRYVFLESFNRYRDVRATSTDLAHFQTLRSGAFVVVGVTAAYPVLRIGHLLIKLGAEHSSATVLTARTQGNCVYLSQGMTVTPVLFMESNLASSSCVEVYDCKRRAKIPKGNIARVIEEICGHAPPSLHTCDGLLTPGSDSHIGVFSANQCRAWFIQLPYILYMRDGDDPHQTWTKYYAFDEMVRKAKKYFERRAAILNHMLGSRVKVFGDKTLNNLKFRNKTGKIVYTIPHIHSLTRGSCQLKAVIVQFDEDVGGSSIDGRYKKGSCLVVPPGKLDEVKN